MRHVRWKTTVDNSIYHRLHSLKKWINKPLQTVAVIQAVMHGKDGDWLDVLLMYGHRNFSDSLSRWVSFIFISQYTVLRRRGSTCPLIKTHFVRKNDLKYDRPWLFHINTLRLGLISQKLRLNTDAMLLCINVLNKLLKTLVSLCYYHYLLRKST